MEDKIADINDLVLFLASMAMKPVLDDEIWQCYGYKKRPKHGNIWNSVSPKIFELENFISKELLTMGLIDVLNGVKKSTKTSDTKLLISLGIVDQFLSTTKHIFSPDLFIENLFSTYTSYLKSEKSKVYEPIILKSKDVLNKKDFAKFMIGTIRLFSIEPVDDYLLNSNYIMNLINKSPTGNKLKISMSEEMYKKYGALLSERILNKPVKIL